jgi:hypothetical protein
MKKTLTVSLFVILFTITACATQGSGTFEPIVAGRPTSTVATQVPVTAPPTVEGQAANLKTYKNSDFGLGFQYPSNWFGPDEYVSGQDVRVAVGSDVVYPYGEMPEQPSEVTNSYSVILQYSKNSQNQYWKDTYQSLINLKDGESFSDGRSKVIRVRQLNIGELKGVEYISTLSDTAQTDPVYIRQVILFDDQSNLLTIMGTPNNVEVGSGTDWRDVYQKIDEVNQTIFHDIVNSITFST